MRDVQDMWNQMHIMGSFSMKKMYYELNIVEPKVPWSFLFYGNKARPKAQMIPWLVCHGKIVTKSRLHKFGMIDNVYCCVCANEETLNHMFWL